MRPFGGILAFFALFLGSPAAALAPEVAWFREVCAGGVPTKPRLADLGWRALDPRSHPPLAQIWAGLAAPEFATMGPMEHAAYVRREGGMELHLVISTGALLLEDRPAPFMQCRAFRFDATAPLPPNAFEGWPAAASRRIPPGLVRYRRGSVKNTGVRYSYNPPEPASGRLLGPPGITLSMISVNGF